MLIAIPKCRASMLLDNDTLEVNTVTHVVGGHRAPLGCVVDRKLLCANG